MFDIESGSKEEYSPEENTMPDISSERALGIAEEACKEEGGEFKDFAIIDDDTRWLVVTNKSSMDKKALIHIDKKTGEIIEKKFETK